MGEPTARAYTLKLSGDGDWRKALWQTHVSVNRGAQVWGDWLLTLRGGLPASLADDHLERRVLLALSWLSVESPAALAPQQSIVARGTETPEVRRQQVMGAFKVILNRLIIENSQKWIDACEPALTARIRDDAVWVDRSASFHELQQRFPGLDAHWAAETLFDFLGGTDEYFALPDEDAVPSTEAKDFVQKAGGWLSRNWGSGEKSNSGAISSRLSDLASIDSYSIVGRSGRDALVAIATALGLESTADDDAALFKQIKQAIGWKGRPSKGALALERIRDAQTVDADLWQRTVEKFSEESAAQSTRSEGGTSRPAWIGSWRAEMESRLGMPYRVDRDLIWEQGVSFDHALRRVSAGHTWIKRAEAIRRRFQEDADRIDEVPQSARQWLDEFREARSSASGSLADYLIRKRAIDGWDKIVQAWADLGSSATRAERIEAARNVQANLDENEKFGDIQLFAGFGDDDADDPQACLADDLARCVWLGDDGKRDGDILKNYVAATVAENDQRRFKVPAYRHPDPLRHPVYVDFGNSRWGITYSALTAYQNRVKLAEKVVKAKTDKTRQKLQTELDTPPDLCGVTLSVWNGECVQSLPLRWHGKRFWKDLDLNHFAHGLPGETVSRADRLGRIAAGQPSKTRVNIAEVFQQKDWNARLQVPRDQLDRLADIVYGRENGERKDPDYAKVERLIDDAQAKRQWERLRWFLTTSTKLRPHGPWLDYVAAGLPNGIEYKKGRSGHYLDYALNKGRKGRARLKLARLPGLRVLSLDLGHRYAAACAVWETITREQMIQDCRAAGHAEPTGDDLYIHLQHQTNRLQKSGRNKGQCVTATTVYRRIGPDKLPDGSTHPAPWAKLERQFLIKLQGEDRSARHASQDETGELNDFRDFLGLPHTAESLRIDDLQRDAVRVARLGLRRLGDAARIAFAMTATKKPISGGRDIQLSSEQRIAYLQDALVLWQGLAGSGQYQDEWAKQMWQSWVVQKLDGPQPVEIADDVRRSERAKKIEATRGPLRAVAEKLADPQSADAIELQRLWAERYRSRESEWKKHLHWLRRLILPRQSDLQQRGKTIRRVGGLSIRRLQSIRSLYQVLKAFRMRPEPDGLRKNIPALGDESLANFGRRILNQLERLREQRIKQLASRVVEAALGAGRIKKPQGRDRKRPQQRLDPPCHAVVVEDLEHYRPEDSRLRRENRQLMDWAARNVRKYIAEGCQLHGLHFVEVAPAYTSRQDSRTGAPGIRCEDVSVAILKEAIRRANATTEQQADSGTCKPDTRFERDVQWWARELNRVTNSSGDLSQRDEVFAAIIQGITDLAASRSTVRLPRRGGELFLSSASSGVGGLQADMNAAANIGLKAVTDPDWMGAWWFLLVNLATGEPTKEKVQGCPVWESYGPIWTPATAPDGEPTSTKASIRGKRSKTDVYAWNPLFAMKESPKTWLATKVYWEQVERHIAERLRQMHVEPENPF